MNPMYSMPGSHPAVQQAIKLLQSWGAPQKVELSDVDVMNPGGPGWGVHTVCFVDEKGKRSDNYIAGLLAASPMDTWTSLDALGMIKKPEPVNPFAPLPPDMGVTFNTGETKTFSVKSNVKA